MFPTPSYPLVSFPISPHLSLLPFSLPAEGATPAALAELNAAREMFGVTFSEVSELYFLVFRHERFVVEAEASMQQLMEKLQLYRHGASINYEVRRRGCTQS